MILGECPYDDCAGPLMIPLADLPLPRFERHACDTCHRIIWTHHSRIDLWSMPEADFLLEYRVDDETKAVSRR